jgi:RecG-like helicase
MNITSPIKKNDTNSHFSNGFVSDQNNFDDDNRTIPNIEGLSTLDTGNSIVGDKLINNINDFNQQYNSYLECTSTGGNANMCINNYNYINSYINALNDTNLKGNVVYDNSNNHISSTYNNILNSRSELEKKMKELYKTNDALYNSDFRAKYDATMLTGIVWSILAGSILYYAFTKI